MEQMMYDNGVDIVLNGHLHEYERTKSVYVSCQGSGPMHSWQILVSLEPGTEIFESFVDQGLL